MCQPVYGPKGQTMTETELDDEARRIAFLPTFDEQRIASNEFLAANIDVDAFPFYARINRYIRASRRTAGDPSTS
jgi:hypothetical protein